LAISRPLPGPLKLRLRIPAIDASLAGAALALVAIGLLTVYSATTVPGAHEGLWMKQLMWLGVAVVGAFAARAAATRGVAGVKAFGYWPLALSVFIVASFTVIVAFRVLVLPMFESE